jgi:hypothetical protein
MITNKSKNSKKKESPLLAKIKFEPTFFQVLWRFAFSLPLQGEASGRGGLVFSASARRTR